MVNIILLGAPGSGKGTLSKLIRKYIPITHVSTGDIFRQNIKGGTVLGIKAKKYIDAGELVPDSIVIEMLRERLNKNDVKGHGFILDGYPRTYFQAKALDDFAKVDLIIVLEVDKNDLKKRILGRRSCPNCGRIYNIFNDKLKPRNDEICDDCNIPLDKRSDDNEDLIEARWNAYQKELESILDYYEKKEGYIIKKIDTKYVLDYSEDDFKKLISKSE
ncbi:MAG: adenylate kinase family protein [Promethearchaeota archaeon]